MPPATPSGKEADIQVRIKRAKKHVVELDTAISVFLDTGPYEIGTKRDPNTRQLIYYLARVENTPADLAAIAGDALHNLRSSLDHLMWLLTLANGQTPGEKTYFPISDDAAKHAAKQATIEASIGPNAANVLNSFQPYKSGNNDLWRLHKLNNFHKHRLLVTVGSAFHFVNVGPHLQASMEKVFSSGFQIPALPALHLKTTNKMCPLKQGDELFVDAPDAEPNQNLQFGLAVAFGQPGVAEGESVTDAFKTLVPLIEKIVSDFAPLI
jgi:hypothetical protein